MKAARQRNTVQKECEGIALLRNRVKCVDCGSPMVRRVCSKRQINESWTCQNAECGKRLRISDGDLLQKIAILMNRIIENSELLIPKPKIRIVDSPTVASLQRQVDIELEKEYPSEEYIVEKVSDIASQLYEETQAKKMIVAQIARKRASMMKPQENLNCDYFSDLVDYVTLSSSGKVRLYTKVGTEITEGENE